MVVINLLIIIVVKGCCIFVLLEVERVIGKKFKEVIDVVIKIGFSFIFVFVMIFFWILVMFFFFNWLK